MKPNNLQFLQGPIPPALIGEVVRDFSKFHQIGAHALFLGQIRNDSLDGKKVKAIEYTAYQEMAEETGKKLMEETKQRFDLTDLRVYHSLGEVGNGEISLFVITLSRHRRSALDACSELVERIKKELPVWGKELLEDQSHQWKTNT